jgi:hypothetical protein
VLVRPDGIVAWRTVGGAAAAAAAGIAHEVLTALLCR